MAGGIKNYIDEAKFRTQKTLKWAGGKTVHIGLRTAMGGGAAVVAQDLAHPIREAVNVAHPVSAGTATTVGATGFIVSGMGGLLSIGLGAGLDGYINYLDHKHFQERLCDFYRPQLAAITGKSHDDIGVADLRTVAKQNPTLQEALDRNNKYRTIKNVTAVAGSLVAFGVVLLAIAFPLAGLAASVAGASLFSSAAGVGFMALTGAIGYASLHAARESIGFIGKKLFGIDKPSATDKIREMSKENAKSITPIQVMEVFVAANPLLAADVARSLKENPQLPEEIRSQSGKKFEDMTLAAKVHVTRQYEGIVHAIDITQSLQKKEINVSELAFLAHDQFSGAYPEMSWREKIKEGAAEKFQELRKDAGQLREKAGHKIKEWRRKDEKEKPAPLSAPEQNNSWRELINTERAGQKVPVAAGRA